MAEYLARGLTADWLNAWLAGIGVTVLCGGAELSWSADPQPKALFGLVDDADLPTSIAARLPSLDEIERWVIAELPQNLDPATYREAAARARSMADPTLAVLTSDLGEPDKNKPNQLPSGPFNVGAPRGETLLKRFRRCLADLEASGDIADRVDRSLSGTGSRISANGLGFDYRRIAASVPGEAAKVVDPVVEVLAFYGLLLHPVSGDGRRIRQRGWLPGQARRGGFRWPVWSSPLDRCAIDGLLDVVYGSGSSPAPAVLPAQWELLGITGLYGVVPFERTGSSDPTRGYASERLL